MRKIFKQSVIAVCIALAVGIFAVSIYIFMAINELPPHGKFRQSITLQDEHSRALNPSIELEEGAITRSSYLKIFHLFSTDKISTDEWYANLLGQNYLTQEPEDLARVVLMKPLTLSPLLNNECAIERCFQSRIKFENIPSVFWKGLIGVEDVRFLDHFGVDWRSIARAIWHDIIKLKFDQGGSTLTQQLVKNLFLTSEKTIGRKVKEIIYSVYLEYILDKEEILEFYFNEVYWGSLQGVRVKGITAASIYFFGKKVNEITPYEATILISLLKGPGYYSPVGAIERLQSRTDIVYKRLIELNLFSGLVEPAWGQAQWDKWKKELQQREREKSYVPFVEVLRNELPLFDRFDRYVLLDSIRKTIESSKKISNERDIAAKVYLFDTVQKSDFFYYSKTERDQKHALENEKHQIGSTLKPIVYSILFAHGVTPETVITTDPIILNLNSGIWSPKEASATTDDFVTAADALERSLNRPLIRLASETGFDIIEQDLKEYLPELQTPLSEFPSQLLGSIELSIKRLVEVYSKFVKKECETDSSKNVIVLLSDPSKTTIRKNVDRYLSVMSFFGKTGTTNNGRDNWFVFYDGRIVGAIWLGAETVNSNKPLPLYGSSTSFKIFQDLFRDRAKRFNILHCPSEPQSEL